MSKLSKTIIFPSQQKAYEELLLIVQVFSGCNWPAGLIKPRLDPILIGQSGVGKSFLVRKVAEASGIPSFHTSYGDWIVTPARTSFCTMDMIYKFVCDNECGIIHIDEIDKARAGFRTEWSITIYSEIFNLLDRTPARSRTGPWHSLLIERLATRFLIVGSGTWQSQWNAPRHRPIGFHQQARNNGDLKIWDGIHSSALIPPELLKRFNPNPIIISTMTLEDYQFGANALELDRLAANLGVALDYSTAVEQAVGARWFEATYSRLLMECWKLKRFDLLPPLDTGRTKEEDEDIPDSDFEEDGFEDHIENYN